MKKTLYVGKYKMKFKKTIKLRKEKFGWLICNIKTCEVYFIKNNLKNSPLLINKLNKMGFLKK